MKFTLFLVMSDQNSILSEQDGVVVGRMSFTEEKNYYQPWRLDAFNASYLRPSFRIIP